MKLSTFPALLLASTVALAGAVWAHEAGQGWGGQGMMGNTSGGYGGGGYGHGQGMMQGQMPQGGYGQGMMQGQGSPADMMGGQRPMYPQRSPQQNYGNFGPGMMNGQPPMFPGSSYMDRDMMNEMMHPGQFRDGQGYMDLGQMFQSMESNFADADSDGDGVLSAEEFEQLHLIMVRPVLSDRFQALDEDGSGSLSTDEMAAPGHMMDRMRRFWGGSQDN